MIGRNMMLVALQPGDGEGHAGDRAGVPENGVYIPD